MLRESCHILSRFIGRQRVTQHDFIPFNESIPICSKMKGRNGSSGKSSNL